jgi:pimeloyl-ACP methyl ester carboxylesterase
MIVFGTGPPLVLIPGIQGRWEWMEPTVRALGAYFRVVTSSLPCDPGCWDEDVGANGFAAYTSWVERLLGDTGTDRATVVGVSFGGLVAAHFAACRPARVQALVLASTPGLSWRPDARVRRYVRAPRLMAPVFVAGAPWRLCPEIVAAHRTWRDRIAFAVAQTVRVVRAPMWPGQVGQRLRLMTTMDAAGWCQQIEAPALVITGEPHLDRVVPVAGSREYASAIPGGAAVATLAHTGHIGCVTRPDAFAELIRSWVEKGLVEVATSGSSVLGSRL